jgi:hypothetical protein
MKKTFKAIFGAAILFALPALLTSCDELFGMEDNPTPSYITINNSDMKLTVGESQTRKAIAAGSAVIVYASANPSIATVDANGTVTGESEGETTITATATGYDGHGKKIYITESKSYNVIVETGKPKPTFTLSASTLSLAKSGSGTITVTTNSTGTISAESDKTDVATATVSGKTVTVTAGTTTGEAKITIKITGDNTYAATKAVCTVTVTEAPPASSRYIVCSWDDTQKKVIKTETAIPTTATEVSNYTDTYINWEAGTYVVSESKTIEATVRIKGDIDLIIKNNATLTIDGSLDDYDVDGNHTIKIYGQDGDAEHMGKLIVKSTTGTAIMMRNIEIHGCKIEATGATAKKGIHFLNNLIIYDGDVTATGGNSENKTGIYGNGICGQNGNGAMKVYGGKVTANGGDDANKIGNHGIYMDFSFNHDIEIYGGTVIAKGGKATGLGDTGKGGCGIYAGIINVKDGSITGIGGQGSKIGGDGVKIEVDSKYLIIDGGTLTATGGEASYTKGGHGLYSKNNITINGGTVTSTGGNCNPSSSNGGGHGIYIEDYGKTLYINGGTITSTGGNSTNKTAGCGIWAAGNVDITNCTNVTAQSGTGSTNGKGFDTSGLKIATTLQYQINGTGAWTNGTGTAANAGDNTKYEIKPKE